MFLEVFYNVTYKSVFRSSVHGSLYTDKGYVVLKCPYLVDDWSDVRECADYGTIIAIAIILDPRTKSTC